MNYTTSSSLTTVVKMSFVGQVKWFNVKAGYGFITVRSGDHAGKDMFVHYTSIKVSNPQHRYLFTGEYVQFDVAVPQDGKHDFHAINVTGISNGPIMYEALCDASTRDKPVLPQIRRRTTRPSKNETTEKKTSKRRPNAPPSAETA